MGLAEAVRSAITAASTTAAAGFKEEVTHEPFLAAAGGFGEATFGAPVPRTAIVSRQQGRREMAGGRELTFKASITFLEPVPIDPRDRITLSDGLTGPILLPAGGTCDPLVGAPFILTVYLGMR